MAKKSKARRSTTRTTTTRALTRSAPTTINVRAPAASPARKSKKGGGGGKRRREHGRLTLKEKGEMGLWGSVLGYLSVKKADLYASVPTTGKLPREVVIGGLLHLAGKDNKHVDRASAAALTVGGFKLGEQGFAISGFHDDDD